MTATARLEVSDPFWDQRISVTRENTLPAIHKQLKETGQWDAFKLQWKPGQPHKPLIYWDSDIAKLFESLCHSLQHMSSSDPKYNIYMDWVNDAIDMISKAQHSDGYVNTYYSVVEPNKRWTNIAVNHELYNAGHLLEAAVAHYELTKSTKFLDIMCRYMDLIADVFGPEEGQLHGYPGHQEIELALLKLYEVRPDEKYLQLAKYFIEQRGHKNGEFYDQETSARGEDPTKFVPIQPPTATHSYWPAPRSYWYMQANTTVRDLKEIQGHSVRAMYYLTGVQHLANLTGDASLTKAVDRMWRDMVDKKLYIHGGIGAIHQWEGFGDAYDLPFDGYAETCASIGILFLGRRMLEGQLRGEVASVMERALFNNVLGGISLDGKSFFYNQPLKADGLKRSDWFEVSCCPPNVCRTFNRLEDYIFTVNAETVAVNLYIGGHYKKGDIDLTVSSSYPWKGGLHISLISEKPIELAVRAPAGSYKSSMEYTERDGYLYYPARTWKDSVTLTWTIQPQIVEPNSKVPATKGMLAIERGPFVYALEGADLPVPLEEVKLSKDSKLTEEMTTINGIEVCAVQTSINGKTVQFIPYFAWGNREPGNKMQVWIPAK